MSLTVAIDRVLALESIVEPAGVPLWKAAGYASVKSARNAVARGVFPIARIQGEARVRFTAANVAAYTQRGEVTNEFLIDQSGPKGKRRAFSKGRMRLVAAG